MYNSSHLWCIPTST